MTEFAVNPVQVQNTDELRRTSDLFMQRLDHLHVLESRKRELPPDGTEFSRLAHEIEDLARALLQTGGHQVALAEEIRDQAIRDHFSNDDLNGAPLGRGAVAILDDWRAAERRLLPAESGTEEAAHARAAVERLRGEYRRLTSPQPSADGDSRPAQA